MKILTTGANGMLGNDLCPLLVEAGFEVIKTDIDDLDITIEKDVLNKIEILKPDFIIHLAAYTNVDKAEDDKETAFKINEKGTKNLALAAKKADIPILYISTDYVFDGTKNKPYLPEDKPNPVNVYGASKLAGEKQIQSICEKFYIARTSWLWGKNGKNFVDTMLELSNKQNELKVVNDQTGCPTWTVALSKAIINLIKTKSPYGIYQLCGSGCTTWYNFAKKIFELSNKKVTLIPVTTEEFPRKAERPRFSAMDNDGRLENWEKSLEKYLEETKCTTKCME